MKNLLLVVLAAVLMSLGWLEVSGLSMLVGLVPMLVVAAGYDGSRRSFWRMTGWTALFIALWYAITVWWVWYATPAGPIASVFFAWIYTGIPFMIWFFVSKRASKVVSYTVLVAGWLVGEWAWLGSQVSFPWVAIGNGFAHDTALVQWYEFTGVYGGTLWVLIVNVLAYEFWIRLGRRISGFAEDRSHAAAPTRRAKFRPCSAACLLVAVLLPIVVSLAMFWSFDEPSETTKVTIVQPNVDPWVGDYSTDDLVTLALEAPSDADFIVMPEGAVDNAVWEGRLARSEDLVALRTAVAEHSPEATLVVGATTLENYGFEQRTHTARGSASGGFYDVYNSAIALTAEGRATIHHKAKMVPGAEMMPTWWWIQWVQKVFSDLDFYAGQYGFGTVREVFTSGEVTAGAGICWESVFGEYFTEFVRNGAEVLLVITNDGWWRDTRGHRQHFDFSRLRAIETRRAVARSALTGRSGFISPRGDVGRTLGWDKRGTITADVSVSREVTFYVRFGDWVCRISLLVWGLGLLYFVANFFRKKV